MPLARFRPSTSSPELAAGLEQIRTELKVPTDFESVLLSTHVGDLFHATIVDLDHDDATVLIRDPAVIARIPARGRALGEQLDVKVVAADPAARTIELAPVAN